MSDSARPGYSPGSRRTPTSIPGSPPATSRGSPGWLGTDSAPDLAYPSPATSLRTEGGPRIQLVRRAEDFARGQRTLAGFVRPRYSFDPNQAETERTGLLAARTIAEGQVRLAEVFAGWADRGCEVALAAGFRAPIPLFIELHRSTVRLVELHPTKPPLVVAQQSEMVQRTRALVGARPSAASLAGLERATGELTVSVGKTLRRKGLQRRHPLVRDDERLDLQGARPITNSGDRFNLACRSLAASGPSVSSVSSATATTTVRACANTCARRQHRHPGQMHSDGVE